MLMEMNGIGIRKIDHLDTGILKRLVQESGREGFRHIQRLVDEYEAGKNRFHQAGEALFIAFRNGDAVGVCGLNQDPYSLSPDTGRVRRLYVSPSVRRLGIGRMLMQSVMAEAEQHFAWLVLRTDNSAADAFYRSLGFSAVSDSEHASHCIKLKSD